ncbi:hypothetical protein CLIB1444_15S00892 [[Candida] jaroonii]|uniref:Uncharacterized protein n=1 Tax=[Candida] jaroonii TaxID=467808 RepID=A0ACA9YFT8_9ASCO|nr:hypothetical protein CLIB1444_15S00892 [[Candida] jaroonii]
MSNPQSVLFDHPPPTIQPIPIGRPNIVSILNLKVVNYFFSSFLIILILQYVCIFITIPCDEVLNRPQICVISSFYDALMFTACCCIFPLGTVIPTLKSVTYLGVSCLLQLMGLGISIPTFIRVLNTENMYSYEYNSTTNTSVKVNITTYIQVVTFISLFFHSLGFINSLINCIITYRGLCYLTNGIDRRNKHIDLEFTDQFPTEIRLEQIKLYRA